MNERYPIPKQTGGVLIRRVVSLFKKMGHTLPLKRSVVIAVSGGVDSLALAVLLTRYGRRLVAKDQLIWLSIDHGWRKESANEVKEMKKWARELGATFVSKKLQLTAQSKTGQSSENEARLARKKIYDELALKHDAFIFTAHHADDLAETLLWRFATGSLKHQTAGIRFQSENEVRPFLTTQKDELKTFLREENVAWFEDQTNQDERFLRARLRKKIIPELTALFPKFVENCVAFSIEAQAVLSASTSTGAHLPLTEQEISDSNDLVGLVTALSQSRLRRNQVKLLNEMRHGKQAKVTLEGGHSVTTLEKGKKFLLELDTFKKNHT